MTRVILAFDVRKESAGIFHISDLPDLGINLPNWVSKQIPTNSDNIIFRGKYTS